MENLQHSQDEPDRDSSKASQKDDGFKVDYLQLILIRRKRVSSSEAETVLFISLQIQTLTPTTHFISLRRGPPRLPAACDGVVVEVEVDGVEVV